MAVPYGRVEAEAGVAAGLSWIFGISLAGAGSIFGAVLGVTAATLLGAVGLLLTAGVDGRGLTWRSGSGAFGRVVATTFGVETLFTEPGTMNGF